MGGSRRLGLEGHFLPVLLQMITKCHDHWAGITIDELGGQQCLKAPICIGDLTLYITPITRYQLPHLSFLKISITIYHECSQLRYFFRVRIGSQSDREYSIKYCRCSYSHHIVELFNFPGNNWQDCQHGGSEKGRNGSCMDTMHSQKVQAFSFSE